jgi:uncharacterized protein (DUF433 family)
VTDDNDASVALDSMVLQPMPGKQYGRLTDIGVHCKQPPRKPNYIAMAKPDLHDLLPLDAAPPPLRVDDGGAVRVGKSRITLALVVEEYESGMTPEDMTRAYDTLALADVYAVIAYYLSHREAVREYMKCRDEKAQALRAKIEAEHPRISRDELLARRSAQEKADAATGH